LTLPLVLAPEAEDDLLDAADWYDAQQPGLGDAFLRSVDASIARIGRFPRPDGARRAASRCTDDWICYPIGYFPLFPIR
jgi:hypothetical protein